MAKTYKIAVIGGDGTGPEVADEAVKVLKVAADKFGFKVELTPVDCFVYFRLLPVTLWR